MENIDKFITFHEPKLSENPSFYVIGNDVPNNPWGASSFRFTPRDIRHLTDLGIRIVSTPHIGLHWPSNSMYPHMGVKISDYTANQSIRDFTDEPENIIEGGKRYFCAKELNPTLSPYLHFNRETLTNTKTNAEEKFSTKTSLAHIHHLSKMIALGENNICLDADILKEDYVVDILCLLVKNEQYILKGSNISGIFNRFVDENGILKQCEPASVSCVPEYVKLKSKQADMIRNDYIGKYSGYIPIKEAILMIDALACYRSQILSNKPLPLDRFVGNTFSVSGIDMINYLKGKTIRSVLQRMYEILCRELTWLPIHMRYFIIPGGIFRFLPSSAEHRLEESVTKSIDIYSEITEGNQKIVNARNSGSYCDKEVENISLIKKRFYKSQNEFVSLIVNRRGFSQYDLLNGEKVSIKIIDALFDLSLENILKIFPIVSSKKA